jgi:hypothetical protein
MGMETKLTETIGIIIGSVVAVVGAAIAALRKLEWIHFGKLKSEKETVANVVNCKECSAHPAIAKRLEDVYLQQIKNGSLHEQHIKNLANNKDEFNKIKSELKAIGEAVAVLLDRSGGRPKGMYDG